MKDFAKKIIGAGHARPARGEAYGRLPESCGPHMCGPCILYPTKKADAPPKVKHLLIP